MRKIFFCLISKYKPEPPELNLINEYENNMGNSITMNSFASLSNVTGTSVFSPSPSSEI